jgi:hypothetical protein
MDPFDSVSFEVEHRSPQPPHVEDRICDFVRHRPECLGRLMAPERAAFLFDHVESDAQPLLAAQRSLMLIRADRIRASFALDGYTGKYETRLEVPGVSEGRGLPCTDLRWRALGRSLLPPGGGTLILGREDLAARLGTEVIYLALGLARQFDGKFWPLVVGVHLAPDYEITVDPKNP